MASSFKTLSVIAFVSCLLSLVLMFCTKLTNLDNASKNTCDLLKNLFFFLAVLLLSIGGLASNNEPYTEVDKDEN